MSSESGVESGPCTTDASAPEWFGIIYGSTQLSFLFIAAIIGFIGVDYSSAYSCTDAIRLWFKAIYNKRSCYYPVFTHIFDQASDYIVVCEFYFLWQEEEKHGPNYCNGLDMKAMFFSSILILILYRVLTSIFIFKYTRSLVKIILQWFDLEFVFVIWLNWKRKRSSPNTVQRWLQSFEAGFEAAPQALLQFMFLIRTGTFDTNYIVLGSFIFSMISLTSRITNDEKYLFIPHAQAANCSHKRCCKMLMPYPEIQYYEPSKEKCANVLNCCKFCRCNWSRKMDEANATESDSRIEKYPYRDEHQKKVKERREIALQLRSKGSCCFISLPYVLRCVYRLCDVSSHMFIYSLLWLTVGAAPMIALLMLDFVIILTLILKCKMNDLLLGVISTRFTRDPSRAAIYFAFNTYRFIVHLTCLVYITIVGYSSVCPDCIQPEVQLLYFDRLDTTVLGIVMYAWCSFLLCVIMFAAFHVNCFVFVEVSGSNDRTIDNMMKSGDIDGILDAISYGYRIEDAEDVIKQALYYVKFDNDSSWYKNIVTDERIHPHMSVLLGNPFIKQKVIDAISSSPGLSLDMFMTRHDNAINFNLEGLLGGQEYLKLFSGHTQKEFSQEMLLFIVSVARYQEYVSSKLNIIRDANTIQAINTGRVESELDFETKRTQILKVPMEYNLQKMPCHEDIKCVKDYATAIYNVYIDDAADLCVNISHKTRATLHELFENENAGDKMDWNSSETINIFEESTKEIINIMSKDSFERYKRTIEVDKGVMGRKLNWRQNETEAAVNIQNILEKKCIV
eukprot:167718_1